MRKVIILLLLLPSLVFSLTKEKVSRFIDAQPGELWRIDDNWTRIYDEPDFTYDDWRYVFRTKYSLTWFDLDHTIALIGKFKYVCILESTGYFKRWKFVKYGIISKGKLKVRYGWILATTVEEATKRK